MVSFLGDIRQPTQPLVISHADGYVPGNVGGLLLQDLRVDGTPPYLATVSPATSGGINVHFNEFTGLPVFVSSGAPGEVFVGSFDISLLDSGSPRRSVTVYRFTVTHTY